MIVRIKTIQWDLVASYTLETAHYKHRDLVLYVFVAPAQKKQIFWLREKDIPPRVAKNNSVFAGLRK